MQNFISPVKRAVKRIITSTHSDASKPVLENSGYCVTCDREVKFIANNDWLRDHYLCSNCGSIPRERALMLTIERFYPDWRELSIHESSPGGRGASLKLKQQCKQYLASYYRPDLALGEIHSNGWRNENLEQQTFEEETFDLVITQDVMEHIFNPEQAFREIAKTLKPGGAHIFTVPVINKHEPSQVRAKLNEDNEIVHLFPPEYHGNPIDEKGSLVTMYWGFDICESIQSSCGMCTTIVFLDDLYHGIRAEYIEVLASRKSQRT